MHRIKRNRHADKAQENSINLKNINRVGVLKGYIKRNTQHIKMDINLLENIIAYTDIQKAQEMSIKPTQI